MAQRIDGGESRSLAASKPHVNYDELEEVLIGMHEELVKCLHSTAPLLEDLVADNILTQAECEEVEAQKVDNDKNDKLLTAMRRKSGEQIGQFCQCLLRHGQQHIINKLRTGMSPNQTIDRIIKLIRSELIY
jgi:hypothetical protein